MSDRHTHKPHGSFASQPDKGAYILREPRGLPDIILFAEPLSRNTIFAASDILSVQGITARIILVEDAKLFTLQPAEYRNSIFSPYPNVCLGILDSESAAYMTDRSIICCAADITAAKLAMTAVQMLRENN